jgi:hypothetical protein
MPRWLVATKHSRHPAQQRKGPAVAGLFAVLNCTYLPLDADQRLPVVLWFRRLYSKARFSRVIDRMAAIRHMPGATIQSTPLLLS